MNRRAKELVLSFIIGFLSATFAILLAVNLLLFKKDTFLIRLENELERNLLTKEKHDALLAKLKLINDEKNSSTTYSVRDALDTHFKDFISSFTLQELSAVRDIFPKFMNINSEVNDLHALLSGRTQYLDVFPIYPPHYHAEQYRSYLTEANRLVESPKKILESEGNRSLVDTIVDSSLGCDGNVLNQTKVVDLKKALSQSQNPLSCEQLSKLISEFLKSNGLLTTGDCHAAHPVINFAKISEFCRDDYNTGESFFTFFRPIAPELEAEVEKNFPGMLLHIARLYALLGQHPKTDKTMQKKALKLFEDYFDNNPEDALDQLYFDIQSELGVRHERFVLKSYPLSETTQKIYFLREPISYIKNNFFVSIVSVLLWFTEAEESTEINFESVQNAVFEIKKIGPSNTFLKPTQMRKLQLLLKAVSSKNSPENIRHSNKKLAALLLKSILQDKLIRTAEVSID